MKSVLLANLSVLCNSTVESFIAFFCILIELGQVTFLLRYLYENEIQKILEKEKKGL